MGNLWTKKKMEQDKNSLLDHQEDILPDDESPAPAASSTRLLANLFSRRVSEIIRARETAAAAENNLILFRPSFLEPLNRQQSNNSRILVRSLQQNFNEGSSASEYVSVPETFSSSSSDNTNTNINASRQEYIRRTSEIISARSSTSTRSNSLVLIDTDSVNNDSNNNNNNNNNSRSTVNQQQSTTSNRLNEFIRVHLNDDAEADKPLDQEKSSDFENLPSFTYSPEMREKDPEDKCAICFDLYKIDDSLKLLACMHTYHVDCIREWLKKNRTCPLCKADAYTGKNYCDLSSSGDDMTSSEDDSGDVWETIYEEESIEQQEMF